MYIYIYMYICMYKRFLGQVSSAQRSWSIHLSGSPSACRGLLCGLQPFIFPDPLVELALHHRLCLVSELFFTGPLVIGVPEPQNTRVHLCAPAFLWWSPLCVFNLNWYRPGLFRGDLHLPLWICLDVRAFHGFGAHLCTSISLSDLCPRCCGDLRSPRLWLHREGSCGGDVQRPGGSGIYTGLVWDSFHLLVCTESLWSCKGTTRKIELSSPRSSVQWQRRPLGTA